jgi:PAS domain S-box-containing protein
MKRRKPDNNGIQPDISADSRLEILENLLGESGTIVYVYDYNTLGVHWANDNLEKMTGYSPSDLKNMGLEGLKKLMHPDDFYIFADRYRFHKINEKHDRSYRTIYRIKHRNGHYVWFYISSIVISRNSDGTPWRVAGMMLEMNRFISNFSLLENFLKDHARIRNSELLGILSKRESEILTLISKGMKARDISLKLNISYHTVCTHRKKIMTKLRLSNLGALTVFAANSGLE